MTNLRKEAKGRNCTVMLDGVCNGNPETTILAHLNDKRLFKCGMGQKVPDWAAAFCCSACHDRVDGRDGQMTTSDDLIDFYRGVFRTQKILFDEGKLWTA